jgi:diguanylate cyclase (GGDEF)-like protein
VEDNPEDVLLVSRALGPGNPKQRFELTHVTSLSAAEASLSNGEYDVVLLDLFLPDSRGEETIRRGLELTGRLPVLVLTGRDDDDLALQAVYRGAEDYLVKGEASYRNLPRLILQGLERNRRVQELRAVREELKAKAYRDPLTDLFNREYFVERLTQDVTIASRYGEMFGILFLDLDNFKAVNDTLGHEAGDRLLVAVSDLLRTSIRGSDFLVRWAGDEFVVLLRELSDPMDSMTVAQKILRGLEMMGSGGRGLPPVAASIGIALFPRDGRSGTELLRNADAAMYAAKKRGKTALFFPDSLENEASSSFDGPFGSLYKGLRDGEFRVHFQPMVDGKTGATIGVEALARWDHPEHGILLPRDFLENLAAFGLMNDFNEQILEAAIWQFRTWRNNGNADLRRLAVNLSRNQVEDAEFPRRLADLLRRSEVDPSLVQVEVSSLAGEYRHEAEVGVMRAIRASGVRVFLDDLGDDACSLSRVRRVKLDGVKLDRGIVRDIHQDPTALAMARAFTGMAAELGMEVTAEGVEVPEQRDILLEMGCRTMQGFLFGQAVPGPSFGTARV